MTPADCGGSFRELGADVMDELEYVPGHYISIKSSAHVWPARKSRKPRCQPEHISCGKYGYHLPLYRQSQMFENQGIDLSGSLLASWVGKSTKPGTTVLPFAQKNGDGSQTRNKPKTARLWVYARDEKPWGSTSPPAAWYQFSTSRGAEHPSKHLETYTGFAHADAYAGYNDAYRTGRVTEMACMAHVLADEAH